MGTSYAKVISKFYRLRMAEQLQDFLDSLPVRGVHESHMGDNIYMAKGELRVGHTYYPVGIRIWLKAGQVVAHIEAPDVHLSVFAEPFDPFKTAELVRLAAMKAAS
jgi:hypothetical protein